MFHGLGSVNFSSRPELVVFDLDFTLWDCGGTWIDCTRPPFQLVDGEVRDRNERRFRLYPEVEDILDELDAMAIPMALASRTEQPDWAREVLDLMSIRRRFAHEEIYPSSKVRHFTVLREASGVDYSRMWFFDDEDRNIREVGELGVTCVPVRRGLNRKAMQMADEEARRMRNGID